MPENTNLQNEAIRYMVADMQCGEGSASSADYWYKQLQEARDVIALELGAAWDENTAEHAVATRMDSLELIQWVGSNFNDFLKVARGHDID